MEGAGTAPSLPCVAVPTLRRCIGEVPVTDERYMANIGAAQAQGARLGKVRGFGSPSGALHRRLAVAHLVRGRALEVARAEQLAWQSERRWR